MKTNVYVDSFNLYYGALKDTPSKWLDVAKLCGLLLPTSDIVQIKYFTARIQARPNDPGAPERQQIFLRAIDTLPTLSIHYGHYATRKKTLPVADPKRYGFNMVEVLVTEEKRSDVNLATHLLRDAHLGRCEVAVVVSNDADLRLPIEVAEEELGVPVGTLNPYPYLNRHLKPTFTKRIRRGALQASQLPKVVVDQGRSRDTKAQVLVDGPLKC